MRDLDLMSLAFAVFNLVFYVWLLRKQRCDEKKRAEKWRVIHEAELRMVQFIAHDKPIIDYVVVPAGKEGEGIVIGDGVVVCWGLKVSNGRN